LKRLLLIFNNRIFDSIGLRSFRRSAPIVALPESCRLERIGFRWKVFAQRRRVAATAIGFARRSLAI
jgi:hypothetical protein